MDQSLSTAPAKSKRKSTRRVSTLTTVQLARKRANDREAQRAIRARTKRHIERLERELGELKSNQGRDQTIQELLRRNETVEKELIRLKELMGAPMASLSSPGPGLTLRRLSFPDKLSTSTACNGNLSTGNDAILCPHGTPFTSDYSCLNDYSQQYIPLSDNCKSLASTISHPIPSNMSAQSSSGEYSASYISTSVPTPVLPFNATSSSNICAIYNKDVIKMEYIEVGHHGTIPQALRQPDIKYGEEIIHIKYLDARFCVNYPPLNPGTPHSHPYALHH
ncbi:hypothetical protein Forpe1208_v016009 [Fusarium oxysporum f. sp. rapae]|uniref:BZIP domain-containing protein n=1 Tax=Fusarium oxysporum f. sp. rapae TaxID=485398 RepID=A0A8J5NI06_FUSOX|nr:hypothetical protein Forpe1208_v016009 [Fusarium oxysporum f. sp. rapae]